MKKRLMDGGLLADHAVWLVIGLALFRHLPLWQVVQEMVPPLDGQALPAPSSSVQARQRLGADHSITLFDRTDFSAAFLLAWQQTGEQRHWLMRARDNLRHEVVQTLGKGDWLIQMPVSPRARELDPALPSH